MNLTKLVFTVLLALGVVSPVANAADGLLLVGTQDEVRGMLKGTEVTVKFNEESPTAMVAVRLQGTTVSVYEGCCVEEIIKLVGNVVKGGVCIILHVGSELCDLLDTLTHTAIELGKIVLEATICILRHATCLVIDGVTFVVQTSFEIMECLAEFIEELLNPCPRI